MSLSLLRQPYALYPSGNPNTYVFQTNLTTVIYLNVRVLASPGGQLIANLRVFATPANTQRFHVDVSRIVNSYAAYTFQNYTSFIANIVTGMAVYNLSVDEVILSGGNPVVNSTYGTDARTAFKAKFDQLTLSSFVMSKYGISGSASYPFSFMTLQPRRKKILTTSDESLYFYQNGKVEPWLSTSPPATGLFVFYNDLGVQIGTFVIDVVFLGNASQTMYRVNTSPGVATTLAGVPLANVAYYTFQMRAHDIDDNPIGISEIQTYIIDKDYCNAPVFYLYWVNKYGAIDTYAMVHPENGLSAERTTMQRNEYSLDSTGYYTNFQNNVFNIVDQIVNTGVRQSITASSRVLNTQERTWLTSALYSPQLYTKITPEIFLPVSMVDTDATIVPDIHLDQPSIISFKFRIAEGFTPDFKL